MTIIFRTNGAWGTGKGSPLSKEEIDNNFWDHEGRIDEIETNPVQPTSIANITVSGSQMSVVLTDATVLGPYTIPRAPFQPSRVETLSATDYTLVITDENAYKRCTSNTAVTITIPPHSTVGFLVDAEITFRQCGAGPVTIVAGSGVTINGVFGFQNATLVPGAVITIKNVAANEWDILGLLLPS
jgi:hypothetical protein